MVAAAAAGAVAAVAGAGAEPGPALSESTVRVSRLGGGLRVVTEAMPDAAFGVYELVRALCLHAVGRESEALRMVEAAGVALVDAGLGSDDYLDELAAQDLAAFYGYVGDAQEAARWVRFAFDRSPAGVDARVLGSELFASVEADPSFLAAVEQSQRDARARVAEARTRIAPPL